MQQIEQRNNGQTERKSIPLFVRGIIAFIACFSIVLAVVIVAAKKSWFRKAITTGDASPIYGITDDASHEATVAPTHTAAPLQTLFPPSDPSDQEDNVAVLTYSTLRLGDDNSAVIALQMRLMELGYMDYDEPSSHYNEVTKSAVMLFQRALEQDTTGVADNDLQMLLFAEDAQKYQVKLSDSGSDVRSIQLRLSELGYYEDKVSGYYGPRTEEAVMRFQSYNELPITGLLSYNSWQSLYSSSAIEAPVPATPTPTPKPTPKPTQNPTRKPSKTATPKPAVADKTQKPTDEVITESPASEPVTATPFEETVVVTAAPDPTDAPETNSDGGSKSYAHSADGIVSCANDQMGKPYISGDEGPDSFDCSGLVYYCLKNAGVSVSRIRSTSYASKSGWQLIESIDALKKGDVICFKSDDSSKVNHVAISLGGTSFIHASSSKGKVVRSSFSAYWNRNFVCARRPIG